MDNVAFEFGFVSTVDGDVYFLHLSGFHRSMIPEKDYTTNPNDHSNHKIDSPGFKPFTVIFINMAYKDISFGVNCVTSTFVITKDFLLSHFSSFLFELITTYCLRISKIFCNL